MLRLTIDKPGDIQALKAKGSIRASYSDVCQVMSGTRDMPGYKYTMACLAGSCLYLTPAMYCRSVLRTCISTSTDVQICH